MKDFADLIRAISSLCWPALVAVLVYRFEPEIRDLFRRVKRGKLFGQEFEIDRQLESLQGRIESQLPPGPLPMAANGASGALEAQTPEVHDTLERASRSPKAGLMLLATDIELELRKLLASMGFLDGNRYMSIAQAVRLLEKEGFLSRDTGVIVRDFAQIRNRIVHAAGATDEEALRAIDSGIAIFKSLKAIPHEINVVYHPGVELYADAAGEKPLEGVKGLVLETTGPDDQGKRHQVFPTTRRHYEKGKRVAWEWSDEHEYDEAWYRDPDTQEIKPAWRESMEFVGRHLDDVVCGPG